MLDVIDSFSRKKAESAELIRSAAVTACNTRQASSQISAWCDRDAIRKKGSERDSRDYLTESIHFVMHLGLAAQERRSRFNKLVTAAQAKREQLVNDAEELREFDMLERSDFESIQELDIQLMQVRRWAADDEHTYKQAVETLEVLYTRFLVVYPTRTGALTNSSMLLS